MRHGSELAAWLSGGLIALGGIPLQVFFFQSYKTDSMISLTFILAMAFAAASILAVIALLTSRFIGSGIVSLVTGIFVFEVSYALPMPWSVLPGSAFMASGMASFGARLLRRSVPSAG